MTDVCLFLATRVFISADLLETFDNPSMPEDIGAEVLQTLFFCSKAQFDKIGLPAHSCDFRKWHWQEDGVSSSDTPGGQVDQSVLSQVVK